MGLSVDHTSTISDPIALDPGPVASVPPAEILPDGSALPIELAAASGMMDEEYAQLPSQPTDSNMYSYGRIGVHNIVVACLPAGQMGTNSAATVASQMKSSLYGLH